MTTMRNHANSTVHRWPRESHRADRLLGIVAVGALVAVLAGAMTGSNLVVLTAIVLASGAASLVVATVYSRRPAIRADGRRIVEPREPVGRSAYAGLAECACERAEGR
ncbi:MAG TPA: hypothetical protein VLR71_12930 [Casimicrobiaceae bacterium]|nr:hypothetical protein [Casimicrobiaceae bacterium]